ncbi:mannose-1-phosphate guanylyltransferase/mannose-6-phosphate isomerase [Flaviflagellibacter deserti]|uniref:mannose-1-phosphate guanylyltransferase n=1 Tax=Flaviflagellibacter deserti TaxID=2267266 RepID=A0ABV9ZAR5_9HYPH
MIIPLVLSGGSGTRLWPASREARPKQFLPLFGDRSTFQSTLLRFKGDSSFGRPIIMTNRDHRFLVSEQLSELGIEADIVLELTRRDSGPAIAAGAHLARKLHGSEVIIVVVAADHMIDNPDVFSQACKTAAEAAKNGLIVTFGITPDHPSAAYGYLAPGPEIDGSEVRILERFVEKPDTQNAEIFIAQGYLWNSGNFVFSPDVLLQEYAKQDPETEMAAGEAVDNATPDLNFLILDDSAFSKTAAKSIDYAVMEKTSLAAVLPVHFGWSDVGSWNSVWALSPQDGQHNVLKGPVVLSDARNNLVVSDKLLTAVVGVEDLAIIATEDAVLVAKREDATALKRLVGKIRQTFPNIAELGARVHRPWGSYQSLDVGERYQVKRIVVKPGGQLSLQKHHHRSEHWVVVRGTAKVTLDAVQRMVHENESIYIPIGAVHRLENPGKIDIELIEVQTGSYLGEDDIIRLEDVYNRNSESTN